MPPRGTIEAIYGMIVTQAREPLFYRNLGVSDTVNGRFDLLILHLWMVLRRLRVMAGGEGLTQALCKNVLNGGQIENARRLAVYAASVIADLDAQDDLSLLAASWKFPLPELATS